MVMPTTTTRRGLQTSESVLQGMLAATANVQQAKAEGKPIVWTSILLPPELLHSMDVPLVFSEGLSAAISLAQMSGPYCQKTEEFGYSRDICAFQRCYMGCALAGQDDFFAQGMLVPPDLVIASNFSCMSSSKAFLFTVDHYNIPYFFLDTPLNTWRNNPPEEAIAYFVQQLKELIQFLESHGFKYDEDRLRHEIEISQRILVLREEIEKYTTAIPSPGGGIDAFLSPLLMAMSDSELGLQLLEKQRDELKERAENKIGTLDEERFRLFWYGLPAMYNLDLLHYPEQFGGVIVKAAVEWLVGMALPPERMDPAKPLESIALKAMSSALNPPTNSLVDFAVDVVRDYQVDGIIGAVKRSCGLMPGSFRLSKDAVWEKCGVPMLIFDLDWADQRDYDDTTVKANLDPFIEAILANKEK
ncbi:MAG: 2-hydroxyacyl-CoA dehydratase family protein [Chloroflexota bacterium]|nr:2-hydroxyacyl-CoA dehydratase family protein [Chloroflexota bacterium]